VSPEIKPVKVFYSYSHEDETLRNELEKQLSILKRQKVISTWHDRKIEAGSEWDNEISKHLDEADIILLLISADFLASDYAYEVEAPRAMQRHRARLARVIPIILRPVDNWKSAPFGKLQALPTDSVPVTSWKDREEAFADIARGIRTIVAGGEPVDEEVSADSEVNIPRLLPYLCDRSEQEFKLTAALKQHHQSTMTRRPFVCVIHGGEEESHFPFVDRMAYAAIPQALNLTAKSFALERHECEWPSRDVPINRWSEVFAANLGKALLRNSAAPAPEVVEYIALHERPVLLESYVLSDNFLESETCLDQFLSFWNAWPDLPPGRTIINFVSIQFLRLDGMRFFQRRKLQRLHKGLFDYIDQLNLSSYGALGGVVLPELKAIRRMDVETWSRIKEVRERWPIQQRDIRALYEQGELISMEPLAEQLRALLIKYQHQRG
jgi:hypothetical protein